MSFFKLMSPVFVMFMQNAFIQRALILCMNDMGGMFFHFADKRQGIRPR